TCGEDGDDPGRLWRMQGAALRQPDDTVSVGGERGL
ncbi:MAG: hypothetical protein ACI8S6_003796, partial [Myxococcota bacterium]